jgi:hypothetical protein
MDWNTITDSLKHLSQPEYLYIAGAVLALLFVLILIVRRQPRNVTAYATENGRVMVSRSAIVELVQTSCEQIKEVAKPQVRIQVKSKKTHFEVRLKLQSGANLRKIEEVLQAHLRKALTENLGIENLGRINVVATGFKSGRVEQKGSLPKREKPAEPEPEPETELEAQSEIEPKTESKFDDFDPNTPESEKLR